MKGIIPLFSIVLKSLMLLIISLELMLVTDDQPVIVLGCYVLTD